LTHSHWDHIADAAPLKKAFDVPVYVHVLDKANLEDPGSDSLPLLYFIEGVKDALPLEDGEKVKVGDINFEIIHTPGHTHGHICLYLHKYKTLVTGDALNVEGGQLIGPKQEYTYDMPLALTSLKKLLDYDIETIICYHGGIFKGDISNRISKLSGVQ
jgi:glyoxylase-like metal-dependent hydrolase (beta-lactamase superfamily II)